MRCSGDSKSRQRCADLSGPGAVSSEVGKQEAGAKERQAGEVMCVLASGGKMNFVIPARLTGRDGSRPRASCLIETAN